MIHKILLGFRAHGLWNRKPQFDPGIPSHHQFKHAIGPFCPFLLSFLMSNFDGFVAKHFFHVFPRSEKEKPRHLIRGFSSSDGFSHYQTNEYVMYRKIRYHAYQMGYMFAMIKIYPLK